MFLRTHARHEFKKKKFFLLGKIIKNWTVRGGFSNVIVYLESYAIYPFINKDKNMPGREIFFKRA